MTDYIALLDKLRRYMDLWIDGNPPSVQTKYESDFLNLFMNAPISFQEWLSYPYETREEQEKHFWA